MLRAFIRVEVWGEHAAFRAFPSQKFAGPARCSATAHDAGFELPTAEISERSLVLLPGSAIFASSLRPQSGKSRFPKDRGRGGGSSTGRDSMRRPVKGRGQGKYERGASNGRHWAGRRRPGSGFSRTRVSRDVSEIRSDVSSVRVPMALGDPVPSLIVPCVAYTLLRR